MELRKLDADVITKVRSSSSINTVCQSVLELVLNSLDAKAKSIAVRLNLVTLRIQVVDNGEGISKANMELVGRRYFTNKCNSLQDLEMNIKLYGFRGEALANILELSRAVTVSSKHEQASTTYMKTLTRDSGDVIMTKQRPSVGTTVTVEEFFYNCPVRKKRIINELELEDIIKTITSLIIIHPEVNFSIRNDITGELILSSIKRDDIASSFKYVHPDVKEDATILKVTKGKMGIFALLFRGYYENRRIQYIYVNKRPIFSVKIRRCIEKLFYINEKRNNSKVYPIFLLNIKCPYTEVDILLNSTKTMVEFKNWDLVEKCVKKLISSFLGNGQCLKSLKTIPEEQNKGPLNCGISQIRGAVKAVGYKRKNSDTHVDATEKLKKPETPFPITSLETNEHSSEDIYDIIEATPTLDKKKSCFKQPLPINVIPQRNVLVPKELPVQQDTEYEPINEIPKRNILLPKELPIQQDIECDKSLSQFTNDESKGKGLIMDMFLKSTQVYKSDENVLESSQDSQETIFEEESNFVVENNFKTTCDGVSKAMSMSLNVKSTKKIRKHKKTKSTKGIQTTLREEMDSKAMQTTFRFQKETALREEMDSKSLQTTFRFQKEINEEKGSTIPDNYTLVVSRDRKSPHFEFMYRKPEQSKTFEFNFDKKCNCHCHENHKAVMNLEKTSDPRFRVPKETMELFANPFCLERGDMNTFQNCFKNVVGRDVIKIDKHVKELSVYNWKINKKVLTNRRPEMYNESPYFSKRQAENYDLNIGKLPNVYNNFIKPTTFEKGHNNGPLMYNIIDNIHPQPEYANNIPNMLNNMPDMLNNIHPQSEYANNIPNMLNNIHPQTHNSVKPQDNHFYKWNNQNIVPNDWFRKPEQNGYNIEHHQQELRQDQRNVSLSNESDDEPDNVTINSFFKFNPNFVSTQKNYEPVKFDFQKKIIRQNETRPNGPNVPNVSTKPQSFRLQNYQGNLDEILSVETFNSHHIQEWTNHYLTTKQKSDNHHVTAKQQPEVLVDNLNSNQSQLVVTLSEKEKLNLLEKELGAEKSILMKQFLEWNSQFTPDQNEKCENLLDWTRKLHLGKHCYINKRTGYATYATPKNNNLFVISERNEFLPKGMSPIIKNIKPVDNSLSQNGKDTLLEYIMDTYKTELEYVKWQHYMKDMDPKTFFNNIYKAKLVMYEGCVPNINIANLKNRKQETDGIKLNKDIFNHLEIIGQMDKKFIIAKEINGNTLFVFDQHAVHERIRLEHLCKIYKNSKVSCEEETIMLLSQNELSLLRRCDSYLDFVGISLEFFSNGVCIKEVPLCLYYKFKGQESTESIQKIIQTLITEVIELLRSTRGANLKILPRLLHNIISLEACRGAIKFGDELNNQQCIELLQKLSTTDLPFQCAHGRPTVTPLMRLNLKSNNATKRAINFQRLRLQ
uniref:Uncharacterized protein LOC114326397 isoform X1 n=1 Tax=Diabrotica virgifera virgifera TaxID=50390 RepID=A0A6P7FAD4_DIAVI